MAPHDRRQDERRREGEPKAAPAPREAEHGQTQRDRHRARGRVGDADVREERKRRIGVVLERPAEVPEQADVVGDARERQEQEERGRGRGGGDRGRAAPADERQPHDDGPEEQLDRDAVAERDPGDRRTVAIAPHHRDEQRERKRDVGGLNRLDRGRPQEDDPVHAPVANLEHPQRRDERRDHERRREPVGHAGRKRRERHHGEHRGHRPQEVRAVGEIRIRRVVGTLPMDDGVRLPIDLVMEVERQPVVARVCRERERERDDRHRTEKQQFDRTTKRRRHCAPPRELAEWRR